MLGSWLCLFAFTSVLVHSQAISQQTFWPGNIPLAVRSPYLNAWVTSLRGPTPDDVWPGFWNDQGNILGWSGMILVDGSLYRWQGRQGNITNTTNTVITPTRSIFTIPAGPVVVNVTYLSPIEPSDWVRQSFPFSYVYVDVASVDGQPHAIQVYSDISGEWVSGIRSAEILWNTTQTGTSVYHQTRRTTPEFMQEASGQYDSTVYYAMKNTPGMTWQTGEDIVVRGQFQKGKGLTNTQDLNFRPINSQFPVFGLSVNLGNITATSSSIVWAIGAVRDPVIQTVDQFGATQNRSLYFWTRYPNIGLAIDDFVSDFPNAQQRAIALDQKIMNDAMAISANYTNLVSLAARQTIGGTEITVSKKRGGQWDTSDVQIFMKDMGNSGRVNPVETIYASFPMFLYLNASLGGLLLDPLLKYQSFHRNAQPYALPDLGTGYPVATGNNADVHIYGVEHSGNMLIMTLAHAMYSGDGSLIAQYYDLLKGWANYSAVNAMNLRDQVTADPAVRPNMTNLAIKGIIGVQAMSLISRAAGKSGDVQTFANAASSLVAQWQNLGGSSGLVPASFDGSAYSGLMYNLFADRLLRTNLVNQTVYSAETQSYSNQASQATGFGIEYNSDAQDQARSDWTLFTAGICTDNTTRDQLISMVHSRASFNQTPESFPTLYNINTGNSTSSRASPAQGAVFAMLSLNLANRTITIPPFPKSSNKVDAETIAGAVIGSVASVAALAVAALYFWRKKMRRKVADPFDSHEPTQYAFQTPSSTSATLHVKAPSWSEKGQLRSGQSQPPTTLPPPTSQAGLSSTLSQSTASTSADESTLQLRDEVENLRREMQELRSRGEAPPSYV